MLTGKLEKDLPESRRSFSSATVDDYPFVFKEYQKHGYKTVFAEDYPDMNVFNYRLNGFGKTPTTKYLRPWWLAARDKFEEVNKKSPKCNHEFTFDYMRNFLKEYKMEKKFLFTISNLAHNFPRSSVLIDRDLKNLYTHMNETGQLNHSLVIVFGDHGDRTSEFRKLMQGKLEERLPFMGLTLPSWFKNKFPILFQNLKSNSKLLTTHYDIHMTLHHVVNKLGAIPKHKLGRSLFSDITSLNRTCANAGIDTHWCPCLSYAPIDANNHIVKTVATKAVKHINKLLSKIEKANMLCSTLKLVKIIRAGEMKVNTDVEQFQETKENEECNECGIVTNETQTFQKKLYEVIFVVEPSLGEYEASAEYNLRTGKLSGGSISRINLYGDQPKCIAREFPHLRKYCFCKLNI